MKKINIKSHAHDEFIDITTEINKAISESEILEGICLVYTPHTTAGITINENADPDVITDMILGFNSLNFEKLPFKHREGNSASHMKSSIVGCSEQLIINNGSVVLGTWQGVYFCEFDGPRNRSIFVTIIGK